MSKSGNIKLIFFIRCRKTRWKSLGFSNNRVKNSTIYLIFWLENLICILFATRLTHEKRLQIETFHDKISVSKIVIPMMCTKIRKKVQFWGKSHCLPERIKTPFFEIFSAENLSYKYYYVSNWIKIISFFHFAEIREFFGLKKICIS